MSSRKARALRRAIEFYHSYPARLGLLRDHRAIRSLSLWSYMIYCEIVMKYEKRIVR